MKWKFYNPAGARLLPVLLLLLIGPGCSFFKSSGAWRPPYDLPPASDAGLGSPEANYAAAEEAEAVIDPRCVDFYYAAAAQSWPRHAARSGHFEDRDSELYRSAVRKLVINAARFGRLQPEQGLRLGDGCVLPIHYHGFAWRPSDFASLAPVGTYDSSLLKRRYYSPGAGVDFVVFSSNGNQRPFLKNQQPFAATAVLRPAAVSEQGDFQLEFYNPLTFTATLAGEPLSRDITAPIAYVAVNRPEQGLSGFLQPGASGSADGLTMIEPYQPGKIPLVFIHGLLSDPLTWADLANSLRADPEIAARYQMWSFRYSTGEPFFTSAAVLRRQLSELRQAYDPGRTDSALSDMVLIGHSMGGLVAKLQVTYSGNDVWNEVASQPLSAIRTDEQTRFDLSRAFYFDPSPDITRVLFIGTPHQGSSAAQLAIGRVASALVEEPSQMQARHAQLVSQNPGVFRQEVLNRVPTSIDLLEPGSNLLQATTRLPFREGVRLHSILGTGVWRPRSGESDGVVPVYSSRLYGVQSELVLDAKHTELHHRPESLNDILGILKEHAAAYRGVHPSLIDAHVRSSGAFRY